MDLKKKKEHRNQTERLYTCWEEIKAIYVSPVP